VFLPDKANKELIFSRLFLKKTMSLTISHKNSFLKTFSHLASSTLKTPVEYFFFKTGINQSVRLQ